MDVVQDKGKPNWKLWDEFMVDAWIKDVGMFETVNQFLFMVLDFDISSKSTIEKVEEVFTSAGVKSRSPKNDCHTSLRVRAHFFEFFPRVNDLLWDGNQVKALSVLRKYKLTENDRFNGDREVRNIKKCFKKMAASVELPLIPGTNAVPVRQSRRSQSDWATVKQPARQRRSRV